jgi:hypothetical protein
MNRGCLLLLSIIFAACSSLWAEQDTTRVSLCSLQENPERFLNSKVELEALIFEGVEYPRLTEGKCSFRFAGGDDYQTFGDRFPVKDDGQWKLMKKLLGTTRCASNVRVVKARIKGTVTRVPATGTIPESEMPVELVIQSVSEVSRVPIRCTAPNVHSPESSVFHKSGGGGARPAWVSCRSIITCMGGGLPTIAPLRAAFVPNLIPDWVKDTIGTKTKRG